MCLRLLLHLPSLKHHLTFPPKQAPIYPPQGERREDKARASEIGKSEEMEVVVEWRVVERRDDKGSQDMQGLKRLKSLQ